MVLCDDDFRIANGNKPCSRAFEAMPNQHAKRAPTEDAEGVRQRLQPEVFGTNRVAGFAQFIEPRERFFS
jgi:hypothetical protein